jgi:uncharacterized membrane protein YbhN (UPF0104 family)
MERFLHAVSVFVNHLAAVHWELLALAVLCHVTKVACVARAWRNAVAASYPDTEVRWRTMYGGYLIGVGINAIIPARAGDAVKLVVVKRRVDGATYPTLAATLVLLNLFDIVVATLLIVWASQSGLLPNLHIIRRLRAFDTDWFLEHPRETLIVLCVLLVAGLIAGIWAWRKVVAFKERVSLGFAAFRDREYYLRHVVPWQAADWTLRVVTIYFFLRAFAIPATAKNALLVQVSQGLSTVFPFSPSGIGTAQALIVTVLHDVASRTAILAFSVGTQITVIAVNVALGFIAMGIMLGTFDWRGHTAAADDAAEG